MILFLLIVVLLTTAIGSLVGHPLAGLLAGTVLVAFLAWANWPRI